MLRRWINQIFNLIDKFLYDPKRVLIVFVSLVTMSLVFDGTLLQLWKLKREHAENINSIKEYQVKIQELDFKIARAQKLDFIEREARNRFDLVEEGDLVFVFTESE
tara:strand:+ start:157 stop:474 length:318 start_codon:yes stop_codon:yes gene_type:complete